MATFSDRRFPRVFQGLQATKRWVSDATMVEPAIVEQVKRDVQTRDFDRQIQETEATR